VSLLWIPCATSQGSLDWVEVDLSPRPASSFRGIFCIYGETGIQTAETACERCTVRCTVTKRRGRPPGIKETKPRKRTSTFGNEEFKAQMVNGFNSVRESQSRTPSDKSGGVRRSALALRLASERLAGKSILWRGKMALIIIFNRGQTPLSGWINSPI